MALRRLLCAATVIAAFGTASVAGATSLRPATEVTAQPPVVLLIHGGGWILGKPKYMMRAARLAREQGLAPVIVRYPLGGPRTATRVVAREAIRWRERGRVVYAYGESVGGTMAEMLAAKCLVDAAVANSAPSDLLRWPEPHQKPNLFEPFRELFREISPFHQRQCSDVLAMHSRTDATVAFRFAAEYARKFAAVELREIRGGHIGAPYGSVTAGGLRWLAERSAQ